MPCCGKEMCYGCYHANVMRELEQRIDHKCLFCRHPAPKSVEESDLCLLKRAEANDPVAMSRLGGLRIQMGDHKSAFDYWTKAAHLGDAKAHFQLSAMYYNGEGVEKDVKKRLRHLKEAAIRGHPGARYNLAMYEKENGRHVRAARHLIISAKLGDYESLEVLKLAYQAELVSKDDFAAALRGYQAAVDATKSPQREAGEAAYEYYLLEKGV